MRKFIFSFLLSATGTLSSFAEADFTFEYNESDKTCTLAKATNVSGEVVIPSAVEKDGVEYKVTAIGDNAFYGVHSHTSVTIPEGVTSIGHGAFWDCDGLTSVTIPESVSKIGNMAFCNCNGLTSVIIPEGVTSIGKEVFSGCSGLESVTIPESVTTIGYGAFWTNSGSSCVYYYNAISADCEQYAFLTAKTLILGQKVKKWPEGAAPETLEFWQGVESVNLSNCTNITLHLTDIDEWALKTTTDYRPFYGFPNADNLKVDYNGKPIKNLTLGSKVDKIAPYAFAYFPDLQEVTFPEYLEEIGYCAFSNSSVSTIMIPSGVTNVGGFAFNDCKNLGKVSFLESIETLGEYVFQNCTALYDVILPANLKELPYGAFRACTDLEEIKLPESLTTIGTSAFYGCAKLKTVNFPVNLEVIGDEAFYETNLGGEIKFGKALRSIGGCAFYGLKNNDLTVRFSEGLESIGSGAFRKTSLRKINLPESLSKIGGYAFAGTKLSDIIIPEKFTAIGSGWFSGISSLTSVSLPSNLEEIGSEAFSGTGITEIKLPETLKTIGSKAFKGANLVNCVIPDGVYYIGETAFGDVKCVTLGKGMESISERIADNIYVLEMKAVTPPALGTDRLGFTPKIVIVPEGAGDNYTQNNRWKDYNISARNSRRASVYISEPGTLATECRIQTGYLPAQITNLIVEGELNEDDFAVMRSNMTACYSFDLSKVKNTTIQSGAFKGKSTLVELTLSDAVASIGNSAFEDCTVMHLTALPSNLKTVGESAFANCQSMDNNLVFPSSIESIGGGAFNNCYSLRGVDFTASPDATLVKSSSDDFYKRGIFSNCRNLQQAILPENLTEIPNYTFYGSGLRSICIPSNVSKIGRYSFADTKSMGEVIFTESLKTISEYAFQNSGIEAADFPKSLESISEYAFAHSSIVYADIKEGVNYIPTGVFSNCSSLMVINLPSSLTSLGKDAVASNNLAAISSGSLMPASTSDGSPFNGVDNYSCSLTIPKQSYSKYLGAEYWGSFVDIRNWIDVTLPEPSGNGSTDEGAENSEIELTYIDEEDYQKMLEEETEETDPEGSVNTPASVRRHALKVLRRDGVISNSRGYGKLFNGASLFAADNSRTRFFLSIPETVTEYRVLYNGKDVTDEIDREIMSFVTPELTSISSLQITAKYPVSGVEEVIYDEDSAPIYTLTGTVAGYGQGAMKQLPSGIYIFCGKKIIVN
ncbi:MAG: leucine-rich repeat domain-containing protein [Bacteroides sp.]|nr:leucine-rich repeat domain-containing protein [Bacteroides sp.]